MSACCDSCTSGGSCEIEKSHKGQTDRGRDPNDFDSDRLAEGMAHELEQTDYNSALKIAMNNLAKDPDHYTKSTRIETAESINWRVRKNFKVVRKLKLHGLDISIEHDKGMVRHWRDDATGEEGKTKMSYPYGYICRTDGADGEQVDVYVGPNQESDRVFIVHQMKKPGFVRYDEDKVMIGFDSAREAKAAYLMHFDDPRFFGSMTQTDIDSFKRMFVKKSLTPQNEELADLDALYRVMKSVDGDLSKGLLDKLKQVWVKVKQKFGGSDEDEPRPQKKWVRNTSQICKTGVCERLDGVEIDIDDTFTAMNGMQIDGPPAHLHCKCGLEFRMDKAIGSTPISPEAADMTPPASEGPPMAPMMPMIPINPHDVETFEGVQDLLRRIGSVKDNELMTIASKIWGDGYTFEGQLPEMARAEIIGFLLDQRDLLGVEPMQIISTPSPNSSAEMLNGSSPYSEQYSSETPSPEVGSSEEAPQTPSLMDWFAQDFSENEDPNQESEPTKSRRPESRAS